MYQNETSWIIQIIVISMLLVHPQTETAGYKKYLRLPYGPVPTITYTKKFDVPKPHYACFNNPFSKLLYVWKRLDLLKSVTFMLLIFTTLNVLYFRMLVCDA